MHRGIAIAAFALVVVAAVAFAAAVTKLGAAADGAALYCFALGLAILYASVSLARAGRF